ncbi:MAG: NADH:ubiquinone reductase (Na(+)-transporting) subunit A [Alphaproteobacteria bacterium]
MFKMSKGLDLSLKGKPELKVYESNHINSVAILGADYIGLKPKLIVEEGDNIKLGDPLFYDKNNEKVLFTAPASGKVRAINRGEKRALESIVIDIEENQEEKIFESFSFLSSRIPSREVVINNLLASGLWTSFRARPFGKIPNPQDKPAAIFVNAMDTNPLALDVSVIIDENKDEFVAGVKVLKILADCELYICYQNGAVLPEVDNDGITYASFKGKHPAGLSGTHIHFLKPASINRSVWYLSANDVILFGKLFLTGKIPTSKIIALSGSMVKKPRLLKTRIGASIKDITDFELKDGEIRIISGSVLSGHIAKDNLAYLGKYHQQITAIPEGKNKEVSTLMNGCHTAIVPFDIFDRLSPLDILPIPLLKSLAVLDTENSQALGALELEEEDVALFSYACPGKNNYGRLLRKTLEKIEKEG